MADTYFSHRDLVFVWDEEKNEKNNRKHNISFYLATAVFDDLQRIEFPNLAHSESEDCYITIGLVHDILTVVYCPPLHVAIHCLAERQECVF